MPHFNSLHHIQLRSTKPTVLAREYCDNNNNNNNKVSMISNSICNYCM
jgi:hypothetical protein